MLNSDEMQIVTVKGYTIAECVEKIRMDYGDRPVKRTQRAIKLGGFLGLGRKDGYEVTFVIPPLSGRFQGSAVVNSFPAMSNGQIQPTSNQSFEEERKKIIAKSGVLPNPQLKEVLDEVKALRDDLQSQKKVSVSDEHPTVLKIEGFLENNEFTLSYSKQIVERIKKEFSLAELDDFDKVQDSVVEWIGESVKITKPEYTARPQVIILVGPTGVGKTTTVAKIAARYVRPIDSTAIPKKVAIITTDSYRIAAKQQIETYGKVLDIPVESADSFETLQQKFRLFETGYDFILIDTIGYSPKDYEGIGKMRKVLDVKGCAVETYLTMTASTKISDMRDIIQQYEVFGYNSVIITKVDETNRIGNVISALAEKNKSVVYITTGQHVPRCFENASALRFLMQLADFKIDRETLEEKFK